MLVGIALLWAVSVAGSLLGGIAFLTGSSVYGVAERPISDEPESNDGTGSTTISFVNLSNKSLKIVGYNNPCSCVKIRGLPLELSPRGKGEIVARAQVSKHTNGAGQPINPVPLGAYKIKFLTTDPDQKWVWVDVKIL
jgi:hypothetical protein